MDNISREPVAVGFMIILRRRTFGAIGATNFLVALEPDLFSCITSFATSFF